MEGVETGLVKKTFVLIFLSVLLYAAFLLTGSLAVLADAIYSLTDALFVFTLWISLVLVHRRVLSDIALKLTSLSITILSLILVFSSALLLYSGFLALRAPYVVQFPEVIVAVEILFVFVLFYVYTSLREEALREDIRALVAISRDVERNILASFLVILAALFSMIGMHSLDPAVAILISAYVLYRSLLLSYRSFRSIFGVSDPLLEDAISFRVKNAGVKLKSLKIYGIGPYYYVEIVVEADHLPDRWDRIEEIIRRRVEEILPASAKVVVSPGGGI